MIATFPPGFLRRHLICHFHFYDGPVTGLALIDGRYWHVKRLGDINCGRFRLTPIQLTAEIVRHLEDYRRTYHHCFYCRGERQNYDGRPLAALRERWGGRNPIEEQAGVSR